MEKAGRKEREHQIHRREILQAAEKVFAKKGFFHTKMSEIAQKAEFGTGTLYKFFHSKQELYFTLINEKTEEVDRLVKAELLRKAPAKERFERILHLQFEFMEQNKDFFRIYVSERNRFEWTIKDELGKEIHKKMVSYIQQLANVMKEGIAQGHLRPMDPLDMAHALAGVVNSFFFEWLISPRPYPLISKVKTVLEILLRGIEINGNEEVG